MSDEAAIEVMSEDVTRQEREIQARLRKWFHDAPERGEDPCKLVVLYRMGGDKHARVDDWAVQKGMSVPSLAAEVWQKCEEVATALEDTVRFELRAYFGSQSTHNHGVWHGTVHGFARETADLSPGRFDAVGPKDIVSYSLQSMAAKDKITHQAMVAMFRSLQEQIESLSAQVRDQQESMRISERERVEMIRGFERTLSEEQDRALARVRLQADLEMKQEAMKTAMLVAPILVNRLVGKTILPEPTTAQRLIMKELFAGLKPEQLMAMTSSLSAAQKVAVLQIYESFAAEEEQDAKKRENEKQTQIEAAIQKAKTDALAGVPVGGKAP